MTNGSMFNYDIIAICTGLLTPTQNGLEHPYRHLVANLSDVNTKATNSRSYWRKNCWF